ncbi:chemotaxis-specific protein-glutamate methyltransferase CheB [Roseomonas sp. SSH11]|uniref:Protein-glutamate methylesterase/protein-glutamine glutaminase n=1 Tax=Pararoseomonas baculiformis TaxID=2820812 RepID=A0ABS4AAV9_9PROT|nr:chemotaxis-specific protein-glutamate methyltransferase CheB [Pararoseomonas baculiformis]MBP0443424.1 chemotaxis-specific protein-glutamate methyltransferase CheB [Pararoseomonas baculiformis]
MIVEDSAVVRQLLAHIVSRDPRLQLAAAVSSAEEALAELERVRPDVISMDIRLPGMDGLEATRRIMAERPTPIVVIADAVEERGFRISMNALRAGALTVVEKPFGPAREGWEQVAESICTQLYIMSQVPVIRRRASAAPPAPPAPRPMAGRAVGRPALVGVAASTGGPPALARVLGALPPAVPVPVLVVQHMGAPFMEGFAAWLNGLVAPQVEIAKDRMMPRPGHVYVAPGDRHLGITAGGLMQVSEAPPVGGQRPAADVLFQSMARHLGPRGMGILLTGMGEDGARGLTALHAAGGLTLAEDETSAVVYGMPAAAVRMGGVSALLPLDLIGPRLLKALGTEAS